MARIGEVLDVERPSLVTDVDRELDDALSTLWLVRGNEQLSGRLFEQIVDLLLERTLLDLRTQLVTAALETPEARNPEAVTAPGKAPATREDLVKRINEAGYGDLDRLGLVSLPDSVDDLWKRWQKPEAPKGSSEIPPDRRLPTLFGILLTAALLSLGAPFWYSSLANLLKLRSMVARKEEAQRNERQTTQTPGLVTTTDNAVAAP